MQRYATLGDYAERKKCGVKKGIDTAFNFWYRVEVINESGG